MIQWVALRTVAQREIALQNRLNQLEYQAMVPTEVKWRRRNSQSRHRVKREYPLFPRYCFVGVENIARDHHGLRTAIPDITGIVSRGKHWSPLVLDDAGLKLITLLSRKAPDWVDLNPHKALQVGGSAQIIAGPLAGHTVKIDSVTAKKAKVFLKMLNSMQVVEISVAALEAA